MSTNPTQYRLFAVDDFRLQTGMLVGSAFYAFAISEVNKRLSIPGGVTIWQNEARRLVHFQVPSFVRIAAMEPTVGRVQAVRDAVRHAETRADENWSRVVRLRAKIRHIDPSTFPAPSKDRQQQFFREVLERCEAALSQPSSSESRLPHPALEPWDYVSSALVFQFQSRIAACNACLATEVGWWEDRVDTYFDSRLGGWTRIHGRHRRLLNWTEAACRCIDVDEAWAFAAQEVAMLSGMDKEALVLPDKAELAEQSLQRALVITKPRSAFARKGTRCRITSYLRYCPN